MEFLQHQIGESDAEVGRITSAWHWGYAETAEEILVNLVAVEVVGIIKDLLMVYTTFEVVL